MHQEVSTPAPRPTTGPAHLIASPLVGRAAEIGLLRAALDDALAGDACAVEVVGEAGIGKTALLDDLSRTAGSAGAVVLRGRAAEFERDRPFGPMLGALDGYPHGLDSAEPVQRHVALDAIRSLLATQSRERPVVVLIDDLHWADRATVELVESLMHRPPRGRVLLVVAYRPRQRDSAVSAGILRAVAGGQIRRVAVGPIGVDDAATILTGHRSRSEVAEMHATCGGNPFYLHQVARGVSAAPAATVANQSAHSAATAALLESELAPLSASARALLDAAAVVGDPFDVDLAATVAGDLLVGDGAAMEALDELVAADLVRTGSSARAFVFRHPLVRSGVYHAIGAGSRLAAHGRASTALAAAGASDLDRAHHVDRSAPPGDPEAIALLIRAGEQVAGRAPASAAHWLGAAWSRVPSDERSDASRSSLLYALGLALTVSGQGERALEITREAVQAFPPEHPLRPWFDLGHASIESTLGRMTQARARLLGLDGRLPSGPTIERLSVSLALAMLDASTGQADAARQHAATAAKIADEMGVAPVIASAAATRAWVDSLGGDVTSAKHHREIADAGFADLSDDEVAAFPVAFAALVRTTWLHDRFEEASHLAARGLVLTRGSAWPLLVVQFLSAQAMAEHAAGNLGAARDATDAVSEAASLLDNSETRYWAFLMRSIVLEPTSQLPLAQDAGERAVEEARHFRGSAAAAGLAWARALLAADQPQRAIEVIDQTHGGADLSSQFYSRRAESYATLAAAHLLRGEVSHAEEAARNARVVSAVAQLPMSAAHADSAAAQCALASGEPARAVTLAASAAGHARGTGATLPAARFDLIRGRALTETGDRDAAAVALRGAEAVFAAAGADRLQAEAARLLRQAGRRVTRSGRGATGQPATTEPLTVRQREIATLASAGRTNREIAQELFLSLKTVETHLSAAYVKLGVASRKELVEQCAGASSPLADLKP